MGPLQVLGGVGGEAMQAVGEVVPGMGGVGAVLGAVVYLVKVRFLGGLFLFGGERSGGEREG